MIGRGSACGKAEGISDSDWTAPDSCAALPARVRCRSMNAQIRLLASPWTAKRHLTAAMVIASISTCLAGAPSATAAEVTFPQVSPSVGYLCAILPDGGAACAGTNSSAQITVPLGLGRVTQISAGDGHVCAIKQEGGKLVCWGDNSSGRSPPDLCSPCTGLPLSSSRTSQS